MNQPTQTDSQPTQREQARALLLTGNTTRAVATATGLTQSAVARLRKRLNRDTDSTRLANEGDSQPTQATIPIQGDSSRNVTHSDSAEAGRVLYRAVNRAVEQAHEVLTKHGISPNVAELALAGFEAARASYDRAVVLAEAKAATQPAPVVSAASTREGMIFDPLSERWIPKPA